MRRRQRAWLVRAVSDVGAAPGLCDLFAEPPHYVELGVAAVVFCRTWCWQVVVWLHWQCWERVV